MAALIAIADAKSSSQTDEDREDDDEEAINKAEYEPNTFIFISTEKS